MAQSPSGTPVSVPPATDPAEQRARPRYACGTVRLTRLSVSHSTTTYFAWVHDVSENGIGLDVLAPLTPGVGLVFELKYGDDRPVKLYAQVVHATPAGAFYRLGCKFARPLRPWRLARLLQQLRGTGRVAAEAPTE